MRKYGNSFQLSITTLFYRLQMSDLELNKKSASEIIQIDPIVPKTPKVHGGTNQETRKAAVGFWNIVEELIVLLFKIVLVILGFSFCIFYWFLIIQEILYCSGVDLPEKYRPIEPSCEPKT